MKKNTFKKKIMAAMMAMFMVVSMVCIKADAETVGTGMRESITAYTLYVRENGNDKLLGKMRLSIHDSYVENRFTADRDCGLITVTVSEKNYDFKTSSTPSLGKYEAIAIMKYAKNPSKVYGSCTVNY
ncbi:MAG: hypothetical protein NC393_06565 [Clostridium sp.]|nr:hypothetical protein [Clostridium sp.]MCM1171775.1 hypothetical protein [Clostridium sp.]MCM1207973.1 hypothetical protein [Ruminococcus sp.]